MQRNLIVAGLVAVLMAGFVLAYTALHGAPAQPSPAGGIGDMSVTGPAIPPVTGYAEGQAIQFIHTEASDKQVADMLTQMMGGSPVLVVPSLADAPGQGVAPVYVFQNGVTGVGPFGFQADVFAAPPTSPDYTPLRRIHFVRWNAGVSAREIRSVAEIEQAVKKQLVTIERTGVIVNMPFLTWSNGHRYSPGRTVTVK